jgi:hypothetical protein
MLRFFCCVGFDSHSSYDYTAGKQEFDSLELTEVDHMCGL